MNTLTLPNGSYLSEYLNFLPSNFIIYKYITGCGATHLELLSERNSILTEPYIPVIKGKANKNIFAVHAEVKVPQIVKYLQRKDLKYFKIITTPEGHIKIRKAAQQLEIDLYKDFFLCVDECEKLIQDVGYRPNIVDVMHDFFKYSSRSFISATPIAPTDPRFKHFGFENYYITPQVKTSIKLNLKITNNIASTVKEYFKKIKNDRYVIFVNSTERIASIIKFLKIESESQVFCSAESADNLRIGEIPNAQEDFDVSKMKRYNFFTSRFFTAFDMILDYKPSILIISDVKKVEYSAVDPFTDVIQMVGRTRLGYRDVTHITNIKSDLKSLTKSEVKAHLDGGMEAYLAIKGLRDRTDNISGKDVLNDALNLIPFKGYLNKDDDTINHFMFDQEVNINQVRGYYKSDENLINAYKAVDRYELNVDIKEYNFNDETIDKLQNGLSRKETIRVISEALNKNFSNESEVFNLSPNHILNYLVKTHQEIYQYYKCLGIEQIRKLGYNPTLIDRAYYDYITNRDNNYPELITSLKAAFKNKKETSRLQVEKILKYFFRKHKIKNHRPTIKQLGMWFEVRRTTSHYDEHGKEVKVYIIGNPKL